MYPFLIQCCSFFDRRIIALRNGVPERVRTACSQRTRNRLQQVCADPQVLERLSEEMMKAVNLDDVDVADDEGDFQ